MKRSGDQFKKLNLGKGTVFGIAILMELTALSIIASATPVVIDFEDLSTTGPGEGNQVMVFHQYIDRGITFNSPVALDYSKGPAPWRYQSFAHSGIKAIEQCYGKEFCTTPIVMNFTATQSRVKVWVGYRNNLVQQKTVILSVFDSAGVQIGQTTATFQPSTDPIPIQTPLEVISNNANIYSATVNFQSGGSNFLEVDDVEFDTAGTPPPCGSTQNPIVTLTEPVSGQVLNLNNFNLRGTVITTAPLENATLIVTGSSGSNSFNLLNDGSGLTRNGGDFGLLGIQEMLSLGSNTITVLTQDCGGVGQSSITIILDPMANYPNVNRWRSIGPSKIVEGIGYSGRLDSIAIDPTDPLIIYVASGAGHHGQLFAGAGVWKTIDGGSTWWPISDRLPSLNIAMLAIDPSAHSRIYAVTDDSGIFRSEDAGISWIQITSADKIDDIGWQNTVLLIHPTNPNILYITSNKGISRSEDRGKTWNLSLNAGIGINLVMSSSNPDMLYAGINGSGIFKTTDGGGNWTKITSPILPTADFSRVLLALSPNKPNILYSIFGLDLYRSDDYGSSWSKQSTLPPFPMISYISVDPVDPNIVYIGGVPNYKPGENPSGFIRSIDGGINFAIKSGPHVDHHKLAINPTDPKIIYVTTDGSIFRSTDRGETGSWKFIGEGITNVQFYDIANSVTNADLVIGGTQDNGNVKYDGISTIWNSLDGDFGDGATVAIDPTNEKTLYAMGQFLHNKEEKDELSRSIDGGSNWKHIANGLPFGCSNSHYQVHPTIPTTLLASCDSLWRTTTSEPPGDWKNIYQPLSGSIVRSAVDPNVDLYYAGANDGRIYAGPSGTNWKSVFVHPNGQGVTDIEVDPNDSNTVYVSFEGTGSGRIYRLQRSSPTPDTMTDLDITSNLPAGPIVQTVAVGWTPLTIYAGTNHGVYRGSITDDGTWWWEPYNNGLPIADVIDLEIHPITKVMRAGTFGRGAFEVNTGPFYPYPVSLNNISQITGRKIAGTVTSWSTNVESMAGMDQNGDLLVFNWSPTHDWYVEDISQITGQKIAGPVTSWEVTNGQYYNEYLAGMNSDGNLLVFYRLPLRDWQVVDVSQITGQKIAGSITSWQAHNAQYNVENLAGMDQNGSLLLFYRSPDQDWQVVDVSQITGQKIAGPVTSWETFNGPYNVEHMAGISPNGDLLVFYWSPQHDWQVVDVSQITGRQITGTVTSWQIHNGPHNVEYLAGMDPNGNLLVFYWSPQHDWQVEDVSQITGQQIAGLTTSWQIPQYNIEHLAGMDSNGGMVIFYRSPQHDWQVVDISRITGQKIAGPVTSWQDPIGPNNFVEHLAGMSPDGDLLDFFTEASDMLSLESPTATPTPIPTPTPTPTPIVGKTVFSIADVTITPNSNITRSIFVENATNVAASSIWLTYDPNVVNVLSVSAGDLGEVTTNIDNTIGKANMTAFLNTTTGKSGNVVFANLLFKAVGPINATSLLTISVQGLIDPNGTSIPYTTKDGTFKVSTIIKGDANGNGAQDVGDGLFALQTVAGLRTLTPEQETAAEVNGNGVMDVGDGLFILQAVAGLRAL